MRPTARLVAVLAGIACVGLLLTGCTQANPGAGASTSSTPRATPAASGPSPRFNLDCNDLISRGELTKLFSDPMGAIDPATDDSDSGPGIPRSDYVRASGGLACEWTNGKTSARTAMSATVSVLPNAAAGWARYRTDYGLKSDTEAYCNGGAPGTSCILDANIHGYWLEADFENIHAKLAGSNTPVIAPAKAVFAKEHARIAALGAPHPAPAEASGIIPAPRDCSGYVSAAQVKAALGTKATIELLGPEDASGDWSLSAQAETDAAGAGGLSCSFSAGSADAGYGDIQSLPGGAWAAGEAASLAGARPISVAGLANGDTASEYMSAADGAVVVDLVVGGNWVRFDLWINPAVLDGAPPATVPATQSASAIAAAIVAKLRG